MSTVAPKVHVRLAPAAGWLALDLAELWRYRDLLVMLAGRDLKVRYKQTALGVSWVLFQPLVAAGIFSFVFANVARFEAPGGVPYFVFTFVGLLAWNVFSGAVTKANNSLVNNEHLVSKIYFPRLILPLSVLLTTLIDFAVTLGIALALLVTTWHLPGANVLLLPVALLLLLIMALGLGFIASAFTVSYRDVRYLLPVVVQLLLFASPVAYAVTQVPEAYRRLYFLNPLVALLETFRYALLGVGGVPWGWLGYSAAVAVAVFVGGAIVFQRMERTFADVI
ncbi:MAG: ABC transporter permease [Longimicrobiales bacterium]